MKKKKSEFIYEKELFDQRIQAYQDLWKLLKVLPRWDRPKPLNATTLRELTVSMRDWYFEKGGIFLSEKVKPIYNDLKEAIEDILEIPEDQADTLLKTGGGASLLRLASRLRDRLAEDLGTRKPSFTRIAGADPTKIQEVAASQLELINDYYTTVLSQANQSFNWALRAAGIGLLFFIAAVGFLLVSKQPNIAAISVISGALVEVISAINFYLYGKAIQQLGLFHIPLERTQRFLLANSVCEKLQGDSQQKARAALVRIVAGALTITPENIHSDKPPDSAKYDDKQKSGEEN